MDKPASSNYTGFIRQLQIYCQNRETGCLFITHNSRAGRIVLSGGVITNLAFANHQGLAAIKEINSIDDISYRFAQIQTNFGTDTSLPDTPSILSELGAKNTPEISSGTTYTQPAEQISKKEVKESLIDVIGPMGEFLCEEYLSGTNDISIAITNICNELSADDKNNFTQQLKTKGYL